MLSPSGPPTTSSVPPAASYVVSPWSYGRGGIDPNLANGGLGASRLETSFTAPDAPGVPVLHPVSSMTEDYAAGIYGSTTTDGGTVVIASASTSAADDGAILSRGTSNAASVGRNYRQPWC